MDHEQDYKELLYKAKVLYTSFDTVLCPTLSCGIVFNSSGFNHILFQRGQKPRSKTSQILRFSLLEKAYKLVGLTTTFQEYDSLNKEVIVKKYKDKIFKEKTIVFWGLVAILDNQKIRVVLRKVGNGNIHFWSVMPYWTTNSKRDEKMNKEKTTII